MEEILMLCGLLLIFIAGFFAMPWWIKKCRQVGLVWEDMNKYNKPKNVAASGGIIAVMLFVLSVLSYLAFRTLFRADEAINVQIFSLLSVVLILAIVGLVDDLLGWNNGGLSKRARIILAVFASIPLVVINAGQKEMAFPILGSVYLGVLYPLILVPLAVAGTTTVYNFLAGFNGLESGQGIIILSFLSFVAYVTGSAWLSVVGLCMVLSLIVFWRYNKNPAKVFPGDILTYAVGAMIACMAILGNFEKIAFIVFIPYLIEMVLKLRGRLHKQSFGIPQKDGSLKMPYDKIYGLTHFSIWFLGKFKNKVYENDVVYLIHVIQIVFVLIAFSML